MSDPRAPTSNPYAEMDEDTAETSLASRFFLWRWYRRTTRGLGASRAFFMPFGFLALSALAFYHGFAGLEELVGWLLLGLHKILAPLSGLFGDGGEAGALFGLQARRAAVPVFSLGWACLASLAVAFAAFPLKLQEGGLGYVVPGSGILARAWGVIGKRLYQLRQAIRYLLAYLRDLNLQKIHLPISVGLLLALGFGSLVLALENLLWELPIRMPGLHASTGWIGPTARITAALVVLVLGIPMLANALVRAHQRSVKLRTGQRVGFVRRRLKGLVGVFFVFAPLAWMFLWQLSGR